MKSTGPKVELATSKQAVSKQKQTWLAQGRKKETGQGYLGLGCSFLRTVVPKLEPVLELQGSLNDRWLGLTPRVSDSEVEDGA